MRRGVRWGSVRVVLTGHADRAGKLGTRQGRGGSADRAVLNKGMVLDGFTK